MKWKVMLKSITLLFHLPQNPDDDIILYDYEFRFSSIQLADHKYEISNKGTKKQNNRKYLNRNRLHNSIYKTFSK